MPTYVEFTGPNFYANETDPSVTATVRLDVASSQTVTVQYATADLTAKASIDYTATSGTLTFPPGTTQQPLTVSLRDDNQTGESSPEIFHINLSNAVNATVGTPNPAAVQIQEDNDGGSNLPPVTVPTPCPDDG